MTITGNRTSCLLAVCLAGAAISAGAAVLRAAEGPAAPVALRCEYRSNPLGIDIRNPQLAWQVNDSRRGAKQTAYQILVSGNEDLVDAEKGNVWDSGKVESDESSHVYYAGRPLQSGRRYYWRVRTWDANGQASPYSQIAWWEMALLSPKDWIAQWITAPEPDRDAVPEMRGQWIWHPTKTGRNARVCLRAAFDVPQGAKILTAKVRGAVDDNYTLYLNGRKIGEGGTFKTLSEHDATAMAHPGRNVLAVEAKNGEGPCGLILGLRVRLADGRSVELHSGGDWRVGVGPEGDWKQPDYDDSTWERAATLGAFGCEPWGKAQPPKRALRSMCLRKPINLKGSVRRARVYVSGLGCYEMTINSERVGSGIFTPGWTRYTKRIQYQVYDVTDMLVLGYNCLGAVLGNAWWSGGLGWDQVSSFATGNLRFLMQLVVDYDDGSQETFVTDESWKAYPSPITRDSFYHGETYDARLEIPLWDFPEEFDDSKWTPATVVTDEPLDRMVADRCEPIELTAMITPIDIGSPKPGVFVFDFGQNAAGWARLLVRGPRGTKVTIRFAEVLNPDGTIYRDNYRSAQATDEYILRGDEESDEEWEPRFTYRGFRYAELTGYPGTPTRDTLTMCVVHSAPPFAGSFACSNELLNRLWRNIQWGQRSNLHSVPTDCPQRDERLGWMGDAQTFAPTACWNMEMVSFWSKWMRDIIDSQGEDGHVTDVAPVAVVSGPAAPGWGDAVVVIPWTTYQFYGDKRIIVDNYDGMKKWIEYMRRNAPGDLYEREGYGDWIAPVESPKKPIGAAYYYYSTKLFSRMAAAIGRADDAKQYGELADRIAKAFNDKYLDKATNWYPGKTQTANILPLWFGITPPDRRGAALKNVVDDIAQRGGHLSTGFLGTAYLLPLLADNGFPDVAYGVATRTTYPSWGYMIEKGATTIWELWDSDKKGPDMNSRNHFALGGCGQWLYESLGGINIDPEGPGFKRIIIRPQPADGLEFARADYPSPYGRIRSAWRREGDALRLDITIPANTTARVCVPTLGRANATVTEGGKPVAAGRASATAVPGIRFVEATTGAAVFDIAAGQYAFRVEPP